MASHLASRSRSLTLARLDYLVDLHLLSEARLSRCVEMDAISAKERASIIGLSRLSFTFATARPFVTPHSAMVVACLPLVVFEALRMAMRDSAI